MVVFLFSGCGTITTRTQIANQGFCDGPRGQKIRSPGYSGVAFDVQGIFPPKKQEARLYAPSARRARVYDFVYLIDLPLSALADTLFIPFNQSSDSAPSETSIDHERQIHQ